MNTTKNDDILLNAIKLLGLADKEMLHAVCSYEPNNGRKYGFGEDGLKRAMQRLMRGHYVHHLWRHRNPKFRHDNPSKRQVFLLSTKGAGRIGVPARSCPRFDHRFKYLADPRTEHRLEHELMIARLHACLLAMERKHPELLSIDYWSEGEGVSVEEPSGSQLRFIPDARFRLVSKTVGMGYWFFLEADTGNERIVSSDDSHRNISQKVERYSKLMKFGNVTDSFPGMAGFWVLFLTPRRSSVDNILSSRERSIMEAVKANALPDYQTNFRLLSESDVSLQLPEHLLQPLVWCGEERVPLIPRV